MNIRIIPFFPFTLHRIMNPIRFLVTLLVGLLLILGNTTNFAQADTKVYLDITASGTRKINMAIPWFTNTAKAGELQAFGRELANTLEKALEFHGIISIIPNQNYSGSSSPDWKQVGADYTILGSYTISPAGINYEMRLLDVGGGDMVLGKKYTGTTEQKQEIIFKFCDSVIKELTGEQGIASSQIAFIADSTGAKEAYVTNILGDKTRQITRHRNLVISPRFTPDGQSLSYTSYHKGNQNLYITDLNQSTSTQVLSRRKGMNLGPAWSPDGQRMILTMSKDGNPDLYMLDRKGNVLEQLTKRSGINVSAAWSPNGNTIAFVSDRSGKPQIYLMDLGSKNVQRLTFKGTENAEPSWSPKGDLLAYSSLTNGSYQICTITPQQGATPSQVTKDANQHESPDWSPDGKQLIYSQREGGARKIYAILKNGTFQRQIFSLKGNQTYPRWSSKK
ncbi:MAG: Tol-Pal system beta propeller repeat protein TolB [Desulfocapsaceae bacterium]|nr:Tol-Pal system beta propeller repeat protein TolB [Desulfocapsaceae bacterium]